MDLERQKIVKAYFEGKLDSEQTKALAEWLYSSPEAVAEFKAELRRLRETAQADEGAEAFLEKFNVARSRRRSKRIFKGLYISAAVSACIAAVIVCTLYFAKPAVVDNRGTVAAVHTTVTKVPINIIN